MSRESLIADTSLLSYWVAGGIFHTLKELVAGRLYVPPTVVRESSRTLLVRQAVTEALRDRWLLQTQLSPGELALAASISGRYGVHQGEAEALAVAATRGLVLICDEKAGRVAASALAVKATGSMGVLYKAVELGMLTALQADTAIAQMRTAKQWVPVKRYDDVRSHVEANPARAEWLRNL
mgnify:CR=1 FL=1